RPGAPVLARGQAPPDRGGGRRARGARRPGASAQGGRARTRGRHPARDATPRYDAQQARGAGRARARPSVRRRRRLPRAPGAPPGSMRIAALGDRDPAHLTHREIDATLALLPGEVDCGWVPTDSAEARALDAVDGVWLLPGTPYRDDDTARAAIHHCLDTGTPFLGTCGGSEYASVLADAGVVISAHAPDAGVEGIELADHPFFSPRRSSLRWAAARPVPYTPSSSPCW